MCDLLCNYSNGDLFTCEDIMFCDVSPRKLTWYFIGVYSKNIRIRVAHLWGASLICDCGIIYYKRLNIIYWYNVYHI